MAVSESVAGWSKTAANNNTADTGINWSEGQTPGSVNNSGRGMMAAIANWRDDTGGQLTLAGSVNAYTLTTNQGLDTAFKDGDRLHFVPNLTNTGAATLNVDSKGAKKLRKFVGLVEAALDAGDLVKDGHYIAEYDASADATTGAWIVLNPTPSPPKGALHGMELSRNSGTPNSKIDISAGQCADDTGAVWLISSATITVDCGTTGANGLDTGSLANSTWYHLFAMGHTDGTIAGFASTSTSPTLPTGYTWKRRLGSVKTNGSAQFIDFTQRGDAFEWATPVLDVSVANLSTSSVTYTLASVPTGVVVEALLNLRNSHASSATSTYVRPLTATDAAPSTSAAPLLTLFCASGSSDFAPRVSIPTNTSAQFGARASNSNTTFQAAVLGWVDPRGRIN